LLPALRLVGGGYTVESESSVTFRTDWPFPPEVTLADRTRWLSACPAFFARLFDGIATTSNTLQKPMVT
jgi:hypothetical protein